MDNVLLEMMSMYSGDPYDLYEIEALEHAYEAQGASARGPGGRTAEESSKGIGSGRYHKGEGEKPYQHGIENFLERVDYYKKVKGIKNEKELAALCGYTNKDGTGNTTRYRVAYQTALHEWKIDRARQAQSMLDNGMSKKAVAQKFGIRDSTLASWLNPKSLERVNKSNAVADFLEAQVKEKKMIDVGSGVEKEPILNCSKTKLAEALSILEDRGYVIFGGRVPQATNPGKKTSLSVLATPDQKWKDLYDHPEKIQSIADYTVREDGDGNEVVQKKWQYPASLDSSRLMIRYPDDVAPDGHTGIEKDGTIELRRNVLDLDLKGSHYAQVRIMVDGSKYLKGMAVYAEDTSSWPEGVDVVFNTNKSRDKADAVLKNIKKDPDNPFGALLRETGGQYTYTDANGEQKLGLINKTRQEGDWEEWKDKVPSQFLAKQPMELINRQLGLAISDKKAEFADIMSLTNPTVKKALLEDFADGCDSDSVHMSAAALPRQKYQVILPVSTLADDEVYAPNFNHGETVALIRFPHQGQFEIPILRVNNSNPQGKRLLENAMDAIGINKKNADRLSGADFDGDTVMVVPCNSADSDIHIQNHPPLEGLENFDPKEAYGYDKHETRIEKVKKIDKQGKTIRDENGKIVYEEQEVDHYYRNGREYKLMTSSQTQMEMGIVSNLMMDATLKGAGEADLAAIARHCQVVIDAEKHHLDYKQSEKDNHIMELKKKYQEHYDIDDDGTPHYGASTLITRAKSPVRIDKRKGTPHIDPETGKLTYKESQMEPQVYKDKQGKEKVRQEEVYLLDKLYQEGKSAVDLVYDKSNSKEMAYANYADTLRALANQARKEILIAGDIEYNKQAAAKYHDEAEHLLSEMLTAERNAPRERMAQLYSRGIVLAKQRDNPDMTKKEIKKAAQNALAEGRIKYGASRHSIDISPLEWEAIQSGAINKTNLKKILQYADGDKVREYATPKQAVKLTVGQKSRIRNAFINRGVPAALLARQFNVSVSTINRIIKKEEE